MAFARDAALETWIVAMRTLPAHCRFPLISDYAILVRHLLPSELIDRIFLLDVPSADLFDRLPLRRVDTIRLSRARGDALRQIWDIVSPIPALYDVAALIKARARRLVECTKILIDRQTA